MAVKQMQNAVIVEGILSEIGLERAVQNKNGVTTDIIRGEVSVRVTREVEKGFGEVTLDIPVRFYIGKFTNAGNENSAYTSLAAIIDNGKSIAVVGEDQADCVRITSSSIRMQEFYTPDGRFVTFPSVRGSFINVIRKSDMIPKARFDCEVVIGKMETLKDKEGVEVDPKTLQITGINVGYKEYTQLIPFVSHRPDVISGLMNIYKEEDTVVLSGNLNFSSRTETYYEPVEVGDPIERQRTNRVSELLIDGSKSRDASLIDYEMADIQSCIATRTVRLDDLLAQAKAKVSGSASTRTKEVERTKVDLGF